MPAILSVNRSWSRTATTGHENELRRMLQGNPRESSLQNRRRCEAGQAIVVVAFALVALLAILGLAVDMGYLRYVKRQLQTAADAAAIAGASELSYGDVTTAAKNDSSANGFTDGTKNATVTVNNPPLAGQHIGNSQYVEVIVATKAATFFAKAFGVTSVSLSARAVGHLGSSPNCVYALDPSAGDALDVSGNGKLIASCGLIVNSSSGSALVIGGNGCVTASSIRIVGNYTPGNSGCPSPTPTIGAAAVSNPLAYLTAPAIGSCLYTNFNNNLQTLSPGTYCNGIQLSGSNTYTFNPVTYILDRGGLAVSGGAKVAGTGVTFFNMRNGTYAYAPITFGGNSGGLLTAPTSGSYTGILFFQDPLIGSNSSPNSFGSNTSLAVNGALYFPTTPLSYSASTPLGGAQYTIVVADMITITGNGTLKSDYSSLSGGSPVKGDGVLDE
jgi:Flp pilus assembly protein TadG